MGSKLLRVLVVSFSNPTFLSLACGDSHFIQLSYTVLCVSLTLVSGNILSLLSSHLKTLALVKNLKIKLN